MTGFHNFKVRNKDIISDITNFDMQIILQMISWVIFGQGIRIFRISTPEILLSCLLSYWNLVQKSGKFFFIKELNLAIRRPENHFF
jgi:hypothetical protein